MNKIIFDGRLTADPTGSVTKSGKTIAKFSVANNTGYGDFKATTFYNCTAWQKKAEFLLQYASKGQEIVIEGEHKEKEWTDKNGQKRKSNEVTIMDFKLIFKGDGKVANKDEQEGLPVFSDNDLPF